GNRLADEGDEERRPSYRAPGCRRQGEFGRAMFKVTVGDYSIFLRHQGLPNIYRDYRRNAALVDEFNLDFRDGDACFVGVSRGEVWPSLVVAQRFFPGSEEGFDPAVLLVPEAKTVFIGAGERILAYKLEPAERLWEDEAA